jgi:NAD(P)-dependent dehydrogenase (short-subunit alcohol dehydrogenase family)
MAIHLITGVSTGIGHAAAKRLLADGHSVFGSVRQEADAERLQQELGEKFTPLLFDVTDRAAIEEAAGTVEQALGGENLAGLVNNAGIAVPGPLLYLKPEDLRFQLEVNLIGVLNVTQVFAPMLGAREHAGGRPGRIVNISSVAGQRALPFLGAYAASKHALEGFSEALRRELLPFGVDVIVIGPGPVKTAIWDKGEAADFSPYQNTPYAPMIEKFSQLFITQGKSGLPAEDLGELIRHALTADNPKTRYAAVKQGLAEKLVTQFGSPRFLDRVIGKRLGLLED